MKSKIYVHKIVLDHQPNFEKDPCKDARAHFIASARVYASCVHIRARIFMKIWLVVEYKYEYKFHKDPSFH